MATALPLTAPHHLQDMTKAAKIASKLKQMMQQAWGPRLEPPQLAPAPLQTAAAAHKRNDAALHGATTFARLAGQANGSSTSADAPAVLRCPAGDCGVDAATALRPQPVWRPLPEGSVAALMASVHDNCTEFVAVAEVERLGLPQGQRNSSPAAGPAAGTGARSHRTLPRRGAASQLGDGAARSGQASTSKHGDAAAGRYCAFEVGCCPDHFKPPGCGIMSRLQGMHGHVNI